MINLTQALASAYCKILLIDLKDRTFIAVQVPEEEAEFVKTTNCIDDYMTWFKNNLLHQEDKDVFESFQLTAGSFVVYRRKIGDKYVHSIMETREYEGKLLLFVRDIECIYVQEYIRIAKLIGRIDEQTGLLSRKAFDDDIKNAKKQNIGVIFCDLNGLKYINDNISHKAGDKVIKEIGDLLKSAFPDYASYRIGGDEFVVISYDSDLRNFMTRVVAWHRWLWRDEERPIAAVGYAIDSGTSDIQALLKEAETAMYLDKQIFYERYPKYKRRGTDKG